MAMTVTSNYHVFLSFRGTDTRFGFTGNLYKALTDKGIHTFIDEEELQSGDEITPALFKAIEGSIIAIVVLSEHYASSSFCLEELATIIHCSENKGLMVLPVFYKVDTSDVRHQKGSYGDAFAKQERRFPDKLQKWKMALQQVANLSGYHFKQGDAYEYEYKFIGSIVDWVSQKIRHPARLRVGDYLVGLESRVAKVMKLLDVGSNDFVHMVGIHGMGGIGKSTLARAVYNNLIAQNFDGFCYLENVREKSNRNGLEHLQNVLLQEILRDKNINITSVEQGASVIAQRLQRKKVLLLVDDVDNLKQLEAIVGSPEWFGPGSRVIITTRDQQLLACHQVKRIYKLKKLNEDNALQLLTWKAFKKEKADPSYEDVLNLLLTYASGLPLALEVIGSNLFGKSVEDWKSAINQHRRIPHTQIQDILKVSFDALQDEEKSVFLDIACCFKGYKLKETEAILSLLYDDSMKHHIGVLVDKSLIKIKWDDTVQMHDLIQDMGRKIDHKESHKKPGKRKRLWLQKDIIEVLKHNKGTSKIEIIYFDVSISDREEIIEWDGNGFKEMKNLKILIIKNATFSESPKCLPNSLRVLEWWGYPSNCLPSDFQPHKLVMCKLPHGCFTSFEFDRSSKMFQNLIVLKFDECNSLTQIPDLSYLSNLEKLSFKYCHNLVTVHESIGLLGKLKKLSVMGCRNLVSFPPIHLTSLEKLDFSSCERLESFPEISGKMENIWKLDVCFTPIKEFPTSFVNLVGLEELFMFECSNVIKLPSSILMMPELTEIRAEGYKGMIWVKEEENEGTMGSIASTHVNSLRLSLSRCNLDDEFFTIIGFTRFAHVEYLNLSGNNFTILPECIKEFRSLEHLNVRHCKHLQEIRGVPPNLRYFDVSYCKHLRKIRGIPPNIEYFYAINCESLITSIIPSQKQFEAGTKICYFLGSWIPEWFEHKIRPPSGSPWFDYKNRGPSTSFWFRNKLPSIILCLLITPMHFYGGSSLCGPMVFINGKEVKKSHNSMEIPSIGMSHTYIFELDLELYPSEVGLEKEWNHMEVTYADVEIDNLFIQAMGIHVFKQESSEEDIRFTDPSMERKLDDDLS